jgi:hypothetical protein
VLALFDSADLPLADVADAVQPALDLLQPRDPCSSGVFAFCDDFEPSSGLWTESGLVERRPFTHSWCRNNQPCFSVLHRASIMELE